MSNAAKIFDILATSLSVLYNYFDSSNFFSDLYPAKILNLSAKPFFPYFLIIENNCCNNCYNLSVKFLFYVQAIKRLIYLMTTRSLILCSIAL